MNAGTFVLRGLWYFRTSYVGVLAGSALGAMVLLGAMMAGDSVKETLRQVAAARLGGIEAVLSGGERMFRDGLAGDMAAEDVEAAPVLLVKGTVTARDGGRSLGGVQVVGVDKRFWAFGPGGTVIEPPRDREVFVNQQLARSLGVEAGAALVLRFDKPAPIARDAPLSGKQAELITLAGDVARVCGDDEFGAFSLERSQLPQATVFVPMERLQSVLDLDGRANLLLMRDGKGRSRDELAGCVRRRCQLADYGMSVGEIPLAKAAEIRTTRIFFDRLVAARVLDALPGAQPVITYLANSISVNGREIPYSMVTAVDREAAPFLPEHSNGAVINGWAADDLGAKAGDEVRVDYYALDDGNRLVERNVRMPLVAVVPMTGLAADQLWMPDFPGVAAAEDAADWDPGVPIDLKRIRDKDELYWDQHRGTPKLFMPLETGRRLFGNRWGEFTALRVPLAVASRAEVTAKLLEAVTPELAGLTLQDVAGQGMAGSPVDFAGLFLGMSLFLMGAAVALAALLFRFHIDQRDRESGLLAALGIPPGKVMRWRLLEGLCVVLAGSGVGALLAVIYTRGLLAFLGTLWSGADGRSLFLYHMEPATFPTGIACFGGLMMLVIWLVTCGQARRSASMRMEAGSERMDRTPATRAPWWAAGFAAGAAGALAATGLLGIQGAYFLAGFALLLAGLALYRWVLRRRAAAAGGLSLRRMAELNCGRRAARSMVVVGTMACGVFLVVSVAAFSKHGGDEWRDRHSGAGGFAFWVETTSALPADRQNPAANDLLTGEGIGREVAMRIGPGDDASCFNLNQVPRPRLLATDVSVLAELGAFPIKTVSGGRAKSWNTLSGGPVMRAFVDETTLMWVLKRKLGEQIIYQDEWGRDFPVELAGTLDGTVFQGSLVVDETEFLKHFPSAEGPRLFLLETTGEREAVRAELQRALADQGGMVSTTSERLAAFYGVENTYIAIFHVLGGLGVIVGSAGLGLLTARNLRERRAEFAIMQALGLPGKIVQRLVMREAGQFICWGLGIGVVAALVAIVPGMPGGGVGKALAWISVLVALIAANAWFWSWLCGRRAAELAKVPGECRHPEAVGK